MSCQNCEGERFLNLIGKTADSCHIDVPYLNYSQRDYAPDIPGLCKGDYISLAVCLDCGTIAHFEPIPDQRLKDILGIEDESDKDDYIPCELDDYEVQKKQYKIDYED